MSDFVRIWIMPPLVGGIIGLFTNWLAIKMLFKPLKPIYIGRFRLPFTPGILPQERDKLTESVGSIVSTELLNTEVFTSRVNQPALRGKIEDGLYSVLDNFLSGTISDLSGRLSADNAAQSQPRSPAGPAHESGNVSEVGKASVEQSLAGLFQSPEFLNAAKSALFSLTSVPLGSLVTREQVGNLARAAAEKCGEEDTGRLTDALVDSLSASPDKQNEALVPYSALAPLVSTVAGSLYDSALPSLESWLGKESTRAKAEELVLGLIRQAVNSLGAVQRFLVNSINYEKLLKGAMPGIMDGLKANVTAALSSPDFRAKVVQSVVDYFDAPQAVHGAEGDEADSASGAGPEGEAGEESEQSEEGEKGERPAMVAGFVPGSDLKAALRGFLSAMNGDSAGFARRAEERYAAIQDKTLGQLCPQLVAPVGGGKDHAGQEAGREPVPTAGNSLPVCREAVSAFWNRYMSLVAEKSLGEILGLGDEQKRDLTRRITSAGIDALSANMGQIVDALDVKNMVIDKINALDIKEAEAVVMTVVRKELNWITWLGGILGLLIGLIQSVLAVM